MAIKTTPKQIGEAMFAIGQLQGAKSVPVKAAYAVGKLARACQAEMDDYRKAREKIFTDAGCTVDEKTQQYTHADAAVLKATIKSADELTDAEVEINALPLDIELFKDCEVPGGSFLGLDWAMKPETAAA